MTGPRQFDVCGPLPAPGVTVLEASAGTGKTFTIAALVARMVAMGVAPLSEILVVTFTRMATGELRDRARARLASAEAGLGRLLDAGQGPPVDDHLLQLLATAPEPGAVVARRQRLAAALASFDSATITTTHGFCHMVLAALGVWGEVAPGAALLEDPSDLVEEVVDDLYARYVLVHGLLPFRLRQALQVANAAVGSPGTPLGPAAVPADTTGPGLRRRLAQGTRTEVARRLLDGNLLTYDDLLVRAANALADPVRGPVACARLRQRYRVVLVDEFQDTDLVQWQVLRRAFGDGGTRLVLIGDPKQAVYAFRGADVYAYLDAAREAGPERRFTLDENWRSDADLLRAFDALLSPLHLGHPEIRYRQARAAAANTGPGLWGAPVRAPLRVRLFSRTTPGVERLRSKLLRKDAAVKAVARDLAADVVELLASGAELRRDPAAPAACPRPVGAQDIGVLVRTNRQAGFVQAELRAAGVAVVVAGAQSVLTSPAAADWLRLLEALEHPAARSPAVAVALTPFVGMTAEEIAGAEEATWEALHARLHEWAALVRREGVATLYGYIGVSEGLTQRGGMAARLLRQLEGERRLTDLAHVAELLHAQAMRSHLGLAALRAWLSQHAGEENPEGTEAEQRSRRLDSDAAAVQVLTIHRAKGLEFPVVYCPYLWDGATRDVRGGPVVYHDEADGDRRKLDAGGEPGDPGYERHYATYQAEQRGEELRQLYVALTRARHQLVIWWAPTQNCQHSVLGRLMLSKDAGGDVAPAGLASEPKDADVVAAFEQAAERAPGLVSIEPADGQPRPGTAGPPGAGAGDRLELASFGRVIDLDWRRSSYTSLTSDVHGPGRPGPVVGSEPEEPGTVDEPAPLADGRPGGTGGDDGPPLRSAPSMLATMPAGALAGTFVHRVLEQVDFRALDLRSELERALQSQVEIYPGGPGDALMLASGLEAALTTPLGALGGGSLREVDRAGRLDELRFELPVAGGEAPVGDVVMADLARLFARHVRPGQPLAGYGAALARPELAAHLRGYLTGSLDLVFRGAGPGGAGRFFVADYKTNHLGGPGEPLSTWHYRYSALEAEMRRAHYPLQALFYLVALHRYLRWRLPGYDPAAHLGGAVYLFLRGMVGPATPLSDDGQPCGVFWWRPPSALVTETSDLLAGAGSTALSAR